MLKSRGCCCRLQKAASIKEASIFGSFIQRKKLNIAQMLHLKIIVEQVILFPLMLKHSMLHRLLREDFELAQDLDTGVILRKPTRQDKERLLENFPRNFTIYGTDIIVVGYQRIETYGRDLL